MDGFNGASDVFSAHEGVRRLKWVDFLEQTKERQQSGADMDRRRMLFNNNVWISSNTETEIPQKSQKESWMEQKRQLLQQERNRTSVNCHNRTDCEDSISTAMKVCEDDITYLEMNEEKRYKCVCSVNSQNGVTMNCVSKCGHYCNTDAIFRSRAGDICGRVEYDLMYRANGKPMRQANHFIYTKGVNNRLSVVEMDCSAVNGRGLNDLFCNSCSVTVGMTQTCQKCEMIDCPDGSRAPLVDCSNIEHNSVFDLCERDSIPARDGIFSKLSSAGFEKCRDESPSNDVCDDNANFVTPGGNSILGTTQEAMIDDVKPCNGLTASAGLWYRVEGTGRGLSVSTCGSSTSFDTQISVYMGSCDTLQCVASNDDSVEEECGFGQSAIQFFAEKGSIYHIKVHGFGSATGIFELKIWETNLAIDGCMSMNDHITSLVPSETGLECTCRALENGSQSLHCTDGCRYCNDDRTTCMTKTTSAIFNQQSTSYTKKKKLTYTKGLDHIIEVHELDCTADECGGCDVTVDGQKCNVCSIKRCGNKSEKEEGMTINCTNIDSTAVFDECSEYTHVGTGLLQALSEESFQTCEQDPLEACKILAEQKMDSSLDGRTKCSCVKNSNQSSSLQCYDDNCRFCNEEASVCANITYGGTVSGRSLGLDKEYRQYEYVTGRNEVLRFEESTGACSFSINGQLCNSCEKVRCQGAMEEYEGISVNCTNIDPEAVFTECMADQDGDGTGLFEIFSDNEFEQCIEGENPMDACLRMKQYEETYGFERNTTCECSSNPISGEHLLTCSDSGCLYCDRYATVCATNKYGCRIGRFGEPLSYFDGYVYLEEQSGKYDQVVVEHMNDECTVRLGHQKCAKCELALCADDQEEDRLFHDLGVDCENLEGGASIESCSKSYRNTGVLEVVNDDHFRKCIIPISPEEACLSEATLLEEGIEGMNCDCTANDHGGFDLQCIEEGCLYCSSNRQTCGYDTLRLVFNRLGYQIESSSGFKFISGIDGDLFFQPLVDATDPRDCVVSFNDEECASCEIHDCNPNTRGLRIDCRNVKGGSMVDQCNFEEVEGFLEYLSPQSFLQCISTMDPMEFCEEQKQYTEIANAKDRGTVCTCVSESGETQLSCTDEKCIYCNADASVCKMNALYGGTISKFGFFTSNVDVSQYVQGRQERIAIEQTPEGSCSVSIDGVQCLNCTLTMCDGDSVGLTIDCSNVMEGGVYSPCKKKDTVGIFALLSDSSFDVCSQGNIKDMLFHNVESSSKSTALAHSGLAFVLLALMSVVWF
ncbi:hypothetical protein IV203_034896 [Nitzschia inconspicua]|uniref:Uncharacterized protein n=1 Tax=Nitzschia inconspicua TaxID=303405 RepID=A0A9K3LD23_9STRA|nr:hypothetical protein IV203_034896 [Nitzschia inconspicua]